MYIEWTVPLFIKKIRQAVVVNSKESIELGFWVLFWIIAPLYMYFSVKYQSE